MNLMYLFLFAFGSCIFAFAFVLTYPTHVYRRDALPKTCLIRTAEDRRGAEEDMKGIPDEETQEKGDTPGSEKKQRKRHHDVDDDEEHKQDETHVWGEREGERGAKGSAGGSK